MTHRMPIRWRLTIWYTAVMATALVIFGVGVHMSLRLRLNQAFDEQLLNQADVMISALATQPPSSAFPMLAASGQEGEYLVRLLNQDGTVIAASESSSNGVPIDPGDIRVALAGTVRFRSLTTPDGNTLRIVTVPAPDGDRTMRVLQVGLNRDEVDETMNQLDSLIGIFAPLMLLVSVVGGYFLAGRLLSPVVTITTLAGRISEDDLHARLQLDLPNDEIGRLARTFDVMLNRIERAFDRQRRFTGDAAHELRTPLALMRGEIDLALDHPRTAEEYRASLRGIATDLNRLTSLVGTLLTLARADTRRLTPERTRFDLGGIIASVLEQYSAVTSTAGITLRNESPACQVIADEDLLVQVLVNLLDNAVAHTPRDGTIRVGCHAADDQFSLWVVDSGIGIAEEHLPRVFDRFYRVDPGRGRSEGGTGLGLSICQAIAEAHNGTISLESTPGQGTRVTVTIPIPR